MTEEFIGTESLLALSADLAESAEHVRGGYHLGNAAKLMECAAAAIQRLAHLEPDLEVEQGDN
jgi:hypothetical protein